MHKPKRLIQRIKNNNTLRITLSILFIVNIVLSVCVSMVFSLLYQANFYEDGGTSFRDSVYDHMILVDSEEAMMAFNGFFPDYLLGLTGETIHAKGENTHATSNDEAFSDYYSDRFAKWNSNFFFIVRENDTPIFYNYMDEQGDKSYYPDSSEFFADTENALQLQTHFTFEAHVRNHPVANDGYHKAYAIVRWGNILKYPLVVLLVISAVMNGFYCYLLCSTAGYRRDKKGLYIGEIDRIPMYILTLFFLPIFVVGSQVVRNIYGQIADNWKAFTPVYDMRADFYAILTLLIGLSFLLKMIIGTVSVRLKQPLWWQKSVFYKAFHTGENKNRFSILLLSLTGIQIVVYLLIPLLKEAQTAAYLLSDILFSGTLIMLCYTYGKDFSVPVTGSHTITEDSTYIIPSADLSATASTHAENINFLSRSANAETEKRFINESFSTRLIHNVSHNLRVPLSEVSDNVALLESGTLQNREYMDCVEKINTLSLDLKKTIEDLIRISRATTGHLSADLMDTDICMLLAQMMGEFYGEFEQHDLQMVTEYPQEPILIRADGQFMWYILEGILSVLLKKGVPGTRIFLSARQTNRGALLVFRTTIRGAELLEDAFTADSGLGLATAKVFTELQNGTMRYKCHHDLLTVALSFPIVDSENPLSLENQS